MPCSLCGESRGRAGFARSGGLRRQSILDRSGGASARKVRESYAQIAPASRHWAVEQSIAVTSLRRSMEKLALISMRRGTRAMSRL